MSTSLSTGTFADLGGGGGGGVSTARAINTTAPLAGGGDLSADRTLSITAATTGAAGSMSAADKTKLDAIGTAAPPGTRAINTTSPLTGGGDLSADRTLAINAASANTASYVVQRDSSGDFATRKITLETVVASKAITPGFVTLTDASTISVDGTAGNRFRVTLGGNRTMGTPTGLVDGQGLLFVIKQDGTGSRTLAWSSGYLDLCAIGTSGVASAAGKTTVVQGVYDDVSGKVILIGYVKET